MITAVTNAHNDPEHFALLESYVARMTRKPHVWLVVNDSDEPYRSQYRYNLGQQVVYRDGPSPINGNNASWCKICEEGLIKTHYVAILEHDDWYSPDYVRRVIDGLLNAPLVGFSYDSYWHVPTRSYRAMPNSSHASLAATAFHRDLLPAVHWCAAMGSEYIDGALWGGYQGVSWLTNNHKLDGSLYHLGIKGHDGITPHHREPVDYFPDPSGELLRKWIGTDADNYLKGTNATV